MFMYKPTEKPTAGDARWKAELMATTANAFADYTTNAGYTREDCDTLSNMIIQLAIMANDVAAMLGVVDGWADTVTEFYTFYEARQREQCTEQEQHERKHAK